MHANRRRKKRPNYGLRTVDIQRGLNGFGFTISGQQPCILSCIVPNSPAEQAGLRPGDFLISVNGLSVSRITHDQVVKLIGNSVGRIKMSIAEYYYSDSSDDEIESARVVNVRKPKYAHRQKNVKVTENKCFALNKKCVEPQINEIECSAVEYKVLVGYLGTIEMPKQLLPKDRFTTVFTCIRKLRQEKRAPTAVLMTVLPSCLTLKNINNHILAIYPANRVVYSSSTNDKDSRYFGLVTSAVCENREKYTKCEKVIEISNSCHVFVTDSKLTEHKIHIKKAETFKFVCTPDIVTGTCLEFPKSAMYVVSLIQNMYRLESPEQKLNRNDDNIAPVLANSPQPSASSNSDSGIGFRDDIGNLSDRILVVEFPCQRFMPPNIQNTARPCGIDGSNIAESLENPQNSKFSQIKNIRATQDQNCLPSIQNIRACKNERVYKDRLTVRAMPDPKNEPDSPKNGYQNEFAPKNDFSDQNPRKIGFADDYIDNNSSKNNPDSLKINSDGSKNGCPVNLEFSVQNLRKVGISADNNDPDGLKNSYRDPNYVNCARNDQFDDCNNSNFVFRDLTSGNGDKNDPDYIKSGYIYDLSDQICSKNSYSEFFDPKYSRNEAHCSKNDPSELETAFFDQNWDRNTSCKNGLKTEFFNRNWDPNSTKITFRDENSRRNEYADQNRVQKPTFRDQNLSQTHINLENWDPNSSKTFIQDQNGPKIDFSGPNYPVTEFSEQNWNPKSDFQDQHPVNTDFFREANVDTGQIFTERPIDVPDQPKTDQKYDSRSSTDNISLHSTKSFDLSTLKTVFKVPNVVNVNKKSIKLSSCENLSDILSYKLSPKVYGMKKPNFSYAELDFCENNTEKCSYGSLQNLSTSFFEENKRKCKNSAVSEPDVRFKRNSESAASAHQLESCDENDTEKNKESGNAASWAGSFEKLLEDPIALQTFAEFLKKEFSAENIYFWTACQRYRGLNSEQERAAEAQRIHRRHLCVGAPEPVNVDSHARQFTQQALQEAEPTLFEQAQKQIFNLMKFDSYPRFLKSELYKQCLSGGVDRPKLEPGLMVHPVHSTKLKKSLSNAEDRRRKSLLPWHRKNRSKSKDRGESEYSQKPSDRSSSTQNVHSSQSSLTSLDVAMSCTNVHDSVSSKGSQDELGSKGALCRVILHDGATTVVQIRPTENIRELTNRLLDKRGLSYSAYEVYKAEHTKPLDLEEQSTSLIGCEVVIEQRVVFKLDLPNRKVISVKSKTSKILVDVLRPILHKYGYGSDIVTVSVNVEGKCQLVDIALPVTSVDGQRLNIQLYNELKNHIPLNNNQNMKSQNPTLDEITNKVFEQLLNEKSDQNSGQQHGSNQTACDKTSVKSEDWGSEHSSGIFGKFLRRDSGILHERKKKLQTAVKSKGTTSVHSSAEDVAAAGEQVTKKPLIAKLRAGVKLQSTCSESDELYEGLKRAQRSRLEDQRGTEINFELPDFLKDKESTVKTSQKRETAKFYDSELVSLSNTPVAVTRTLKHDGVSNGSGEPPPLPPKPKILPIKPSNWGQNAAVVFKVPRERSAKHTLYLEHPTSSFV